MTATVVCEAALDSWSLLKAAMSEAIAGDDLDPAEKATLAAAWNIVHSALGGAAIEDSEATTAIQVVFESAYTPWMARMMTTNYPGADGFAPTQMRAAYDKLAAFLGAPLSETLA